MVYIYVNLVHIKFDLSNGLTVSSGIFTFVEKGTINGISGWVLTSNNVVVGTDTLIFSQFSGAGSSTGTAGGLIINGSGVITLDTPSNVKSILNYLDNNDLTSYSGSSNITTKRTITSGVWEGTKISDTYINSTSFGIINKVALTLVFPIQIVLK